MNFIEFKSALVNRSENLDFQERIALEIEICKRLYPFYKAFHNETGFGNPDILLDSIKFVESGGTDIDQIHRYIEALEEITPDTDDLEDSSYALNACAGVFGLLSQVVEPSQADHFLETAMAYYETMDLKVHENSQEQLPEYKINDHPLMIEATNFILQF